MSSKAPPKLYSIIIGAMLVLPTGCGDKSSTPPQQSNARYFTYKAIAGVSMGGGAAGHIGLSRPEQWDNIGILGAPLVDHTSLFRMMTRYWLGGFCSYPTIMQFLEQEKDLNHLDTYCGIYTDQPTSNTVAQRHVIPKKHLFENQSPLLEFVADYNNWWRGPDGGRGGSFNRVSLMRSLLDIQKAFGNTFYLPNEEVPWAAPGITHQWLELSDVEKCANPIVMENFYNAEYNPDGSYPVITFCEGQEQDPEGSPEDYLGRITPQTSRWYPVLGLLAVDYNRNGIRDYSEPIVVNSHERFDDFGEDGLPDDLEEGFDPQTNPDPANDNYDYFNNPTGTEGNYQHDLNEPFTDYGVDGVADTQDYGEGDGLFSETPTLQHTRRYDPTYLLKQLSQEQLSRLSIYLDAGIRDFLNSSIGTNAFFGNLQAKAPAGTTIDYTGFSALKDHNGNFDPALFPPEKLQHYTLVRYGNINASPEEIAQGDGNHVGTIPQVFDRMLSAMSIAQLTWPNLNYDTTAANPIGNPQYASTDSYESATLGKTKDFSYILPPGYFDPENSNERYPVFFFLHGQGMTSSDLLGASLLMQSNMVDSDGIDESRWGKFITIFPDGKCDRDVCYKGNFWVDFIGAKPDQRYYTDFYELVEVVDKRFRTRSPQWVDVPR